MIEKFILPLILISYIVSVIAYANYKYSNKNS